MADSYINTDPKRIKEEILSIDNKKPVNTADFEDIKETEKIDK